MASRSVLFLVPCLLIVAAAWTGASCKSEAPIHPIGPVIAGSGGSFTSTSHSTGVVQGVTSSSSGGVGGAASSSSTTTTTVSSSSTGSSTSTSTSSSSSSSASSSASSSGTLPTCYDSKQDGNETDSDCGGASFMGALPCKPCGDGLHCKAGTDCLSKVCTGGSCQSPTCTDATQNGTETDIDCGGLSCPKCNPGQRCAQVGDCAQGLSCSTTCQCPNGMVPVPTQQMAGGSAGSYCIDATEVTVANYQIFYGTNPPLTSQTAECMWNKGWTPTTPGWAGMQGSYPISGVNWCQAQAYCTSVGKRLCGHIGTPAGVAPMYFKDFTQDQWFNACTSEGTFSYPYGNGYATMACQGADNFMPPATGVSGPAFAGFLATCVGGAPGLHDMSGNVAEWEDSCDASTGMGDHCNMRGGGWQDTGAGLRCDSGGTAVTQTRGYSAVDLGFRCCLL